MTIKIFSDGMPPVQFPCCLILKATENNKMCWEIISVMLGHVSQDLQNLFDLAPPSSHVSSHLSTSLLAIQLYN